MTGRSVSAIVRESLREAIRSAQSAGGLTAHHFMQLLHRGLVTVDFDFEGEWRAVGKLLEVYADLPMSLADACLVRMSELHDKSVVFTLDRDFQIYRKNRRLKIPLLAPFV